MSHFPSSLLGPPAFYPLSGEGSPTLKETTKKQKIGYPYSGLSTGQPSLESALDALFVDFSRPSPCRYRGVDPQKPHPSRFLDLVSRRSPDLPRRRRCRTSTWRMPPPARRPAEASAAATASPTTSTPRPSFRLKLSIDGSMGLDLYRWIDGVGFVGFPLEILMLQLKQ